MRKSIITWLKQQRPSWINLFGSIVILIIGILATRYIIAPLGDQFIDALNQPNTNDQSAIIRNLGLAIVAIIGAPFLVWRTLIAAKQANTAEQGLITDRLNKAVEGLGTEKTVKDDDTEKTVPNLEVRIGAIYALERIAQDSDRDHIQIMEILCAYVRGNVLTMTNYQRHMSDMAPSDYPGRDEYDPYEDDPPTLQIGIQTALTVIGRRSKHQMSLEKKNNYRLDLRQTDLTGADLSGLNFSHAIFDEASLCYSNLIGIALKGASLSRTDLWKACIFDTNLTEVTLSQEQIDQMVGNGSTILPTGMERPNDWPA